VPELPTPRDGMRSADEVEHVSTSTAMPVQPKSVEVNPDNAEPLPMPGPSQERVKEEETKDVTRCAFSALAEAAITRRPSES
jgi:hypothetical protein